MEEMFEKEWEKKYEFERMLNELDRKNICMYCGSDISPGCRECAYDCLYYKTYRMPYLLKNNLIRDELYEITHDAGFESC
jgi:hypothetical protein